MGLGTNPHLLTYGPFSSHLAQTLNLAFFFNVGMSSFSSRVFALCAEVPKGRVTTYGQIAKALRSKAYRAVGQALNSNTHDFVTGDCTVPCHRVVCSDGKLGGFASGVKKKIALLEKEGVHVRNGRVVDFEKKLFRF